MEQQYFGKRDWFLVKPAQGTESTQKPASISSIFTIPAKTQRCLINFLIDSGADVSVLPSKQFQPDNSNSSEKLTSASNFPIKVYGTKSMTFQLVGLERQFQWKFVVADVNRPILGSDFLAYAHAIVDCQNNQIRIDENVIHGSSRSIETIASDQLHNVSSKLYIETEGKPIFQRARRIGGKILESVRREFENMLQKKLSERAKANGPHH